MLTKVKEFFIAFKIDAQILRRAIKLIEKFTPHFFLHTFLWAFYTTASTYIGIYLSARIIDEMTGDRNKRILISMLLIMIFSEFILTALNKLSWRKIRTYQIVSQQWEEIYLNDKSFSLDYASIENPDVRNHRQGIVDNRANGGFGQLMFQFGYLFRNAWTVIFTFIIMCELFFMHSSKKITGILSVVDSNITSVVSAVIVIVFAVILVKQTNKYNDRKFKLNQKLPFLQRILHYYLDDYLDDSKACKDVHIFNQSSIIKSTNAKVFSEYADNRKAYFKAFYGFEEKSAIVNQVLSGIVYFLVVMKTFAGTFGLGGFIKYVKSINDFCWSVLFMCMNLANLHKNTEYITRFFEYLEIPTNMQSGKEHIVSDGDSEYEIELHNVSFKYPKADKYALRNVSVKFHSKEKTAVVGMNGSGKTTMIKLICRLYDPDEGYISINGTDIREYDYADYLNIFSVVFQDFKLFSFSLGENIAAKTEYDEEKGWQALKFAGMEARVREMPNGLKTPIFKDFSDKGVELSGGESQKVAIARALYKDAPFVILDEPTAALDPMAEFDIYSRFNDLVRDKSAIYISHRLSSCRFCDKILVLDNGRLIQQGTHSELLKNTKGKYSELWNSQAQYYSDNEY